MRSRLCLALAAVLGLLLLSAPAVAAKKGETVVSFTFDGTFKGQERAARILSDHGFAGTFYVNSGYVGFPAYLSVEQLRAIDRDRNEVAGASLFGNDLSLTSRDQAITEVCDDRATLSQLGYQVTSFAYPHAASPAQLKSVVQQCGYNSARESAGLYQSQTICSSCPMAETLPPGDDFRIRTTAPSASLRQLKRHVVAAEDAGGGWVPLVFGRVCTCPERTDAVSPSEFTRFVAWMRTRPASTTVETVDQVMGGDLKAVSGTPLKRLVPTPSSAISTSEAASASPDWTILGFAVGRLDLVLLGAAVFLSGFAAYLLARRQKPVRRPEGAGARVAHDGSTGRRRRQRWK